MSHHDTINYATILWSLCKAKQEHKEEKWRRLEEETRKEEVQKQEAEQATKFKVEEEGKEYNRVILHENCAFAETSSIMHCVGDCDALSYTAVLR